MISLIVIQFIGITDRLQYLSDLNVNIVLLSSIFESPDSVYGYGVSSFINIDPEIGTTEDFTDLVESAKKRGFHILSYLTLDYLVTFYL